MKIQVAVLLVLVLLLGGCGTAANEVAKITTPERTVKVLAVTVIPSANLISVDDRPSPQHNFLVGAAGAVEAGSAVKAYDVYPGGTLLYSGTATANGSFSIDIGDEEIQSYIMCVTATGVNKAESEHIIVSY